jgi:integrase/recombinase XerD
MGRVLPQTFTGEEVELLRAAPNLDCASGLRDRCVIDLMLRGGLRVSEVCQLDLRDVDWDAAEIKLRPEITKNGRGGKVYLDAATLALLRRWKAARLPYGAGRPHLFVYVRTAQRGQPLNRRAVYSMIRRRAQKVGIEGRASPTCSGTRTRANCLTKGSRSTPSRNRCATATSGPRRSTSSSRMPT